MKNMQSVLVVLFFGLQIVPVFSQTTNLSEEERKDVIYMLEEEKLARDVYLELGKKWDIQIFQNIASSEERHYASVKQIAKNNNLLIPATVQADEKGKFVNQNLQVLFDELVRTGNQSLVDALEIGAKIEELDIKDLDLALANTENDKLTGLYTRLKKASENHLRAFTKNLNKQGVEYKPVILSTKQYDTIVGKESGKNACCSGEKAKSNCKDASGKKKGKGHGNGKEDCSSKI